jgi:hypothetical protein
MTHGLGRGTPGPGGTGMEMIEKMNTANRLKKNSEKKEKEKKKEKKKKKE